MVKISSQKVDIGIDLILWKTPFDWLWYLGFALLFIVIFKTPKSKPIKNLMYATIFLLMGFGAGCGSGNPDIELELFNMIDYVIAPMVWLYFIKRRWFFNFIWLIPTISIHATMAQSHLTITFVWFWMMQLSLLLIPIHYICKVFAADERFLKVFPEHLMFKNLEGDKFYGTYTDAYSWLNDNIKPRKRLFAVSDEFRNNFVYGGPYPNTDTRVYRHYWEKSGKNLDKFYKITGFEKP